VFNKLIRFIRRSSVRRVSHPTNGPESARASRDNDAAYDAKVQQELTQFKEITDVHALPEIFSYWSEKYLLPLCQSCGVTGVDQFYAKYLFEAAQRTQVHPRFISIGAGNCDTEVRVAKLLRELGLTDFTLECLELNPAMLERGRQDAKENGVTENISFIKGDFNKWMPESTYCGVMANHSLHHVVNLEGLFDAIKSSLHPLGYFVTSDMIGRNGHQRWPEALTHVERIWEDLPSKYKYNAQLKRHESKFVNWDCSSEGFEGIRAQDILPLLVKRFDFPLFIGFANIISPFVDRGFGHNFDVNSQYDRELIDTIHALDEAGFKTGELKPTQMFAVMSPTAVDEHVYARGISPAAAVRVPS
jgi:SAM-dependent methyltransferase